MKFYKTELQVLISEKFDFETLPRISMNFI